LRARSSSTDSPVAPEWSTRGARESPRGLIPWKRRRRHHLAVGTRTPNPRSTSSSTTYTDQREPSGLRHVARPHGLSEAEETAGSAWRRRSPPFSPQSTVGDTSRGFGRL